jgi:hypothetical protein
MGNILLLIAFINGIHCATVVPNKLNHVKYATELAQIYDPVSIDMYETSNEVPNIFNGRNSTQSEFRVYDTTATVQCDRPLIK